MSVICNFKQNDLDFEKVNGLMPAIIQHYKTGKVLMLGYMNSDSLSKTLESGLVTFYSRTRKCLWLKGEVSKNYLKVKSVRKDCDNDTLLILADPQGPTCHRGCESCFDDDESDNYFVNRNNDEFLKYEFLSKLENIINDRKATLRNILKNNRLEEKNLKDLSYTENLLFCGVPRISKKLGEEAVETALAAVTSDDTELLQEASDLFYHLLVLLCAKNLSFNDVISTLKNRHEGYSNYKKEHEIKKAMSC